MSMYVRVWMSMYVICYCSCFIGSMDDVCGDEGMKRWHGTGHAPGRRNSQRHGLLETGAYGKKTEWSSIGTKTND